MRMRWLPGSLFPLPPREPGDEASGVLITTNNNELEIITVRLNLRKPITLSCVYLLPSLSHTYMISNLTQAVQSNPSTDIVACTNSCVAYSNIFGTIDAPMSSYSKIQLSMVFAPH